MKDKRKENEKKFRCWVELPGGGRRYIYEVSGKRGWKAKYVKEVNVREETMRFDQEIYDDQGKLVEIHEKYPEDKGYREVRKEKYK